MCKVEDILTSDRSIVLRSTFQTKKDCKKQGGKNLKRLKEILSKVENTMVDVEFKEIRGEFFDI